MKVKTRLSLFCTLIFGIIFAIMSILIYCLFHNNTEKAIYNNLRKTAFISAWFYLEEDELSAKEFDKIRRQFEELVSDSGYQVYDSLNHIVHGSTLPVIPTNILDRIKKDNKLSFETDEYLCYGIFYQDNEGDFIVIAKEKHTLFDRQVNMLIWILVPLFFVGLLAIILFSRWVASLAYRPFSDAISQVNNISTNNLNVQIKSPKTKDELQDLIETFNTLLAKISETVVIQKNFVRYVSHEFKTPLASMLGNLDLFAIKDREPSEYRALSDKLIRQILQMEEILDTLIIISDLKTDERELHQTRLDELLWEIINKLKDIHPSAKILVNIDIMPEDEALMLIDSDRTQLLIALINLIENAVKYSSKENVTAHLFKNENGLCLSITDKGIGIPSEQLAHISKPFYRANNTEETQGSGIGLSLALRILDKNNIRYTIESEINVGTHVTLFFESAQVKK